MHNTCGEIFSGFCRNLVRISESIRTTCYEINDFESHSFPIFKFSAVKEIMIMGVREVVWPRMQAGRRRRGRSH